jgi:hypothetical protein
MSGNIRAALYGMNVCLNRKNLQGLKRIKQAYFNFGFLGRF